MVDTHQRLEDLKERLLDLSPEERQKEETAAKIAEVLGGIVDEKNEKAEHYRKDFVKWMKEKEEIKRGHYLSKLQLKSFGTKDDKKIQEQIKAEPKTLKEKLYELQKEEIVGGAERGNKARKDIFNTLKKIFNRKIIMHEGNDIDKKAVIFLLEKAKFFKDSYGKDINPRKAIKRMSHDETAKKGLVIDKEGTKTGLHVEGIDTKSLKGWRESKVIISEHSDNLQSGETTPRPTSSTHIINNILLDLGVLKHEEQEQIKRFVKFVDIVDSMEYQMGLPMTNYSHKTLFGLHRSLSIETIFEFFKNPKHTGFEILDDEFLKTHIEKTGHRTGKSERVTKEKSWLEISDEHKKEVEKNIEDVDALYKQGKVIILKNKEGGKNEQFIVDLHGVLKHGVQAVQAYTDIGIFKIYPERGNLYMYSGEKLPTHIAGIKTTGEHFLIVPHIDQNTLAKILDEFIPVGGKDQNIKNEILVYNQKRLLKKQELARKGKADAEAIIKKLSQKQKDEGQDRTISSMPVSTKQINSIKDIELGKWYEAEIKLIFGYGIIATIQGVDGFLHSSQIVTPEGENWKKYYKKGDKITVKAIEFKEEKGKKQVTLTQKIDKETAKINEPATEEIEN